MTTRLTETAISKGLRDAKADGKRRDLADAGQPGLRLRVTPAGAASWILGCRDTLGAARRFALGTYPTMGVSDARESARAMRAEVRKGADPVAEARRKRAMGKDARDGIGTLTALLDIYGRPKADGRPAGPGDALKSWPECRRRIDSVFAKQLAGPLGALKASDLQMTADSHPSNQSAAAAVRYIRPVLKWAAQRGYVGAEAAVIHPPAIVRQRSRVLNRGELALLLPVLRDNSTPYASVMLLMLCTLLRRSEADGACWRDIDWQAGTMTIDATRTKNGQPHIVPLPRQAIALLYTLQPAEAAPGSLIFATRTGRPLPNWDRVTKAIQKASGTTGWHRHDLRRTGATMLGDLGELPDIIEAALNHTSIHSALAATYNRSRYRPQVAAALQRLADMLDGIEAGGANVVPLRQAKD